MILNLSDTFLQLRTITNDDEEMLCQIYSSTRMEELSQLTGWTLNQKETFLKSQFKAQHNYYQNNYIGAHFWVIEFKSQIIGRLYLHTHYEASSMRIIDISILPKWRNRGIGKGLLMDVMELAKRMNRSVTIHVECFNPAMKLYQNLGFELVSKTNGIYHLLEWKTNRQNSQQNILFNQSATNGSSITAFNSL